MVVQGWIKKYGHGGGVRDHFYLFKGQGWNRGGIREGILCGLVAGWVARYFSRWVPGKQRGCGWESTSLPTRIYKHPRGSISHSGNVYWRSGEKLRDNWARYAVGLDKGMGFICVVDRQRKGKQKATPRQTPTYMHRTNRGPWQYTPFNGSLWATRQVFLDGSSGTPWETRDPGPRQPKTLFWTRELYPPQSTRYWYHLP